MTSTRKKSTAPAEPKDEETRPMPASRRDNKLIRRWKEIHQQAAVAAPELERIRAELLDNAQSAGADVMTSRFGDVHVRSRCQLDVGELKKRLIGGGFIGEQALAELVAACTREGNPYVEAPRAWAAEIRLASELE